MSPKECLWPHSCWRALVEKPPVTYSACWGAEDEVAGISQRRGAAREMPESEGLPHDLSKPLLVPAAM